MRPLKLHPHDRIAAVHIYHLAGDARRAVAGEKNAGRAEYFGHEIAAQRRTRFIHLEHFTKTADAARGERVDRAGADAVHTDFFRAEIIREVARAGFERGLGHAHDVVMRHDFFRAEITHAHDAAAIGHQRFGGAGQRHARIRAE